MRLASVNSVEVKKEGAQGLIHGGWGHHTGG